MSFRRRLALFFVLIVVLPMVAVGFLVVGLTGESASGKADARLGAGLETAISIYDERTAAARAAAEQAAQTPDLVAALRDGDPARVEAVARRIAGDRRGASLRVEGPDGALLATIGGWTPIAASSIEILGPDGEALGSLTVSKTPVSRYVIEVERLTGEDAIMLEGTSELSGTVSVATETLPAAGEAADVEVDGQERRAAAANLPGGLRIALIGAVEAEGFLGSSPLVAAILLAFFVLALTLVVVLTRALQGQVAAMLAAARGIGQGDFSQTVPVVGSDEMAGLAREFNKMSGRLSEQMGQLRRQRVEIERSVQRIGSAFASGLDREALLEVVIESAVGTCEADYGLIALGGHEGAEAETGKPTETMREASLAAEKRALVTGELVTEEQDGAFALSAPLRQVGGGDEVVGAMTVARTGEPFGAAQHDVFLYLAGQAAVSVENVALHEAVSQQAVTDELTGLANSRAFRGLVDKEAARAKRFRHDLSVLMLDIDDFKQVNDTYGHPQGDEVLRAIGEVLTEESRGVDEPARYGGEEFIVALPETDLEGAVEVGERIRASIEARVVGRLDGKGELRVTASVGAATIPTSADDVRGLIDAADVALYEAKRAGKNRVVAAPADGKPRKPAKRPAAGRGAKGRAPARRK